MTWVPEACTLSTAERPLRVAEFDDLFAAATRGPQRLAPTRLRLHLPAVAAATARDLAARESACCSFFSFDVQERGGAVVVDVAVPAARTGVLDAVQGRAEAAMAAR